MKTNLLFLSILLSANFAKAEIHLMSGIGFTAPNVNSGSNVGNPQVGDIIFDTSTTGFYGYAGASTGWLALGNSSVTYHAPTIQKCTSSYTPSTTPAPLYIRVKMVGGGGGGCGSGVASIPAAGSGGTSTFGSLLTANGGSGCTSTAGGVGGSVSYSSPAMTLYTSQGQQGGSGQLQASTSLSLSGGTGGATPLGGAGVSITGSNATAAISGSGSGGGGASFPSGASSAAAVSGAGGGAGGYIEAQINNPSGTYSCSVGTGGAAGSPGTVSTLSGGAGASGVIIVEEYFQ